MPGNLLAILGTITSALTVPPVGCISNKLGLSKANVDAVLPASHALCVSVIY
jgi:hypothetical protein